MGRLAHINVKIVVGEDRAPRWRNTDHILTEIHFVDDFPEDAMEDTVPAPRTIVEGGRL
jgi:hypothetical protein